MEILNAKQEAIKKAYGEYWELVKDLVRTDGSLSEPVWIGSDINIDYDDFSTGYFIPKSLQGIENNNGWIKIESEADLPNNEKVWICANNNKVLLSSKTVLNWILKNHDNKITHYQPIEKPLKPLY